VENTARSIDLEQSSAFIEPSDWFVPLEWADWFPAGQPIEVDLGAGDGGFIAERARACPRINFVAVERLLGRARKIEKKARRMKLANLRVLRIETLYAVRWLFPAASIRAFYLLFPDPWPKKKHQRRRIIRAAVPTGGEPRHGRGEFLSAVERALEPGGVLYAATDHEEYFEEIRAAFAGRAGWSTSLLDESSWFAEKTDFERQFVREGRKIGRLKALWSGNA
jgi:tRNA (guanine-N7-)-methyltransferase